MGDWPQLADRGEGEGIGHGLGSALEHLLNLEGPVLPRTWSEGHAQGALDFQDSSLGVGGVRVGTSVTLRRGILSQEAGSLLGHKAGAGMRLLPWVSGGKPYLLVT